MKNRLQTAPADPTHLKPSAVAAGAAAEAAAEGPAPAASLRGGAVWRAARQAADGAAPTVGPRLAAAGRVQSVPRTRWRPHADAVRRPPSHRWTEPVTSDQSTVSLLRVTNHEIQVRYILYTNGNRQVINN